MGGHGGLNILPQKKWNIYRNDVQYKVNYDENKLIKEEEEKERKKNEYLFQNNINELKNNVNNNKVKIEYNGHINLFIEEEKEMNRRKKMHEEYLIKKGHYIYNDNKFDGVNCIYDKKNNAKIISDFDKIKISQNEWFLNRQKNIFLKNNKTNELNNSVFINCYNDEKENFLQTKTLCESDVDIFKHEHKKRKENMNKYEHIRELIKYKKEKKKKKKKKKKEEKRKKRKIEKKKNENKNKTIKHK
ncbi:conserved Plasmodium protein, unknown function [Plasmodium relictum]|uniref:CBF1-interacting co-repressor CIR N-terminal domain-containing protein n=1 Tax=Plasmodium relictum TaxID=85471 RepID=A0A1J1H8L5_PLARL|nr:conserved Plasmodium protein, unknown function [Plasmodium relictum]CRG99784.1 conserved Plasmodium protein, unknown function [Plasmodium relictum]